MDTKTKTITIETTVNAPVEKAWKYWTEPAHITKWNFASDDWQCPTAQSDLKPGGKFSCRMEAKDGSLGFDFGGVYDEVKNNELINYTLGDDRKVSVKFSDLGGKTKVTETFEAESTHSEEMQRNGWQAILDNYKKHVESD